MNTLLFGGVGTLAVLIWRVREGQTPVRKGKIIAPPLGMATGFAMFLVPQMRVPLEWAALAFALGALVFAWPLILTTRLHKDESGQVWMKRSPIFFLMLLALIAVRWGLRSYLENYISLTQTASLAFVLAFGMIIHWRLRMLRDFSRL